MAPASVFDKAHRQLSCHAGASISREEYCKMDNREIWQE